MKRGSVLLLIFWVLLFATLSGAGYYIWTSYSKTPNELTIKTASSIYKYPNATSWVQENTKNLCVSASGCAQPIKIFFETPGTWSDIYTYYTKYFSSLGWTSNTSVVTSIPNNTVLNKGTCKIVMENHGDIKYSFTVACQDK